MSKLVVLNFLKADRGFPAILEIGEDGAQPHIRIEGHLPQPETDIRAALSKWKESFRKRLNPFYLNHPRVATRIGGKVSRSSDCRTHANQLVEQINQWLNSTDEEWQKICKYILQYLDPDDEIRVIIKTEDALLRTLPWSVWDLFVEDYKKAEIALSPSGYKASRGNKSGTKVRILAVLGNTSDNSSDNNDDIDTRFDRQLLETLSGVEIEFLEQPPKEALIEKLWDERGWQIFFFAGHSESGEDGKIGWFEINRQERIAIEALKNSLDYAIERGLQLAIFNSCDGLGLANQLANLNLPHSIVMRELVPDIVAQQFLQNFLTAFASGQPFYGSVREARNKLEDTWNAQYPGMSWLPAISENPTARRLTWQGLQTPERGRARVGDRGLWRCECTLTDHSDFITSVAISPNEQIFASGSGDHTIKLWNLATGQLLRTFTPQSDPVVIAFSPDGQTLASAGGIVDSNIKLWYLNDLLRGEFHPYRIFRGDDWVHLGVMSVAFSPDGKTLISSHKMDGTVRVWNLQTEELLHILRGDVVRVWQDLAISSDGQLVARGKHGGKVNIWNLQTGRLMRVLNEPFYSPFGWMESGVNFFISGETVCAIAIAPDGEHLASSGIQSQILGFQAPLVIKIWNLHTGKLRNTLTGHSDSVFTVAFSPDGKQLASGGSDKTIIIWNWLADERIQTLNHSASVYTVAFSPDGQTLVSGSSDRVIKIWRRYT